MMTLDARERTVALRRPACSSDLGGIGKGFAADEGRGALLKDLGTPNALVALGGDVVAAGRRRGTPGWTIDVGDAVGAEQGTPPRPAARRGGLDVRRRGAVGRDRRRALLAHHRCPGPARRSPAAAA
jgi:hypothetical protein